MGILILNIELSIKCVGGEVGQPGILISRRPPSQPACQGEWVKRRVQLMHNTVEKLMHSNSVEKLQGRILPAF